MHASEQTAKRSRDASRPSNEHTRAVAEFVARTRPADVPPEVMEHAKRDILDCLGCALYGQTLPIAGLMREALAPEGEADGTIWGAGWKAPADVAALVNGTLTHSYELDDLHAKAIIHPGGVTFPAVFALAERGGQSGAEMVAAHVVGLEVSTRVGLAVGVPLVHRGWHNNGVLGVFGSSAGGANLLGLDVDGAQNAIGIAGSLAAGLMAAQFGAMVKRLHAGQAAQSGLRAAQLAAVGFTGIEALFEETYGGYLAAFADSYEIEQVSADFGSRWETLNVGFKFYSACGSSHTTVDVLRGMRAEQGLRADQVKRIKVTGSTATRDHVGWPYEPDSVTTAQMNLPYAAAVAVLDGHAFVDQFREDRLRDPAIIELAGKVEVDADPAIDAAGPANRHEVRIVVELDDGTTLEGHAVDAKGSAAKPLNEEERTEKFMTLASHRLGEAGAEALLEAVLGLDEAADATALAAHLRGAEAVN